MIIKFNPRVNGGFVEHVLRNKTVSELVDSFELTETEAHDIVKSVLIAGFKDFEVDINRVINGIKDQH